MESFMVSTQNDLCFSYISTWSVSSVSFYSVHVTVLFIEKSANELSFITGRLTLTCHSWSNTGVDDKANYWCFKSPVLCCLIIMTHQVTSYNFMSNYIGNTCGFVTINYMLCKRQFVNANFVLLNVQIKYWLVCVYWCIDMDCNQILS